MCFSGFATKVAGQGHRRTFCGPEPPGSRPAAGAVRLETHVERTLRTDAPFAAAALAAGGAAAPWREAPWVSCFCPRVLYVSICLPLQQF